MLSRYQVCSDAQGLGVPASTGPTSQFETPSLRGELVSWSVALHTSFRITMLGLLPSARVTLLPWILFSFISRNAFIITCLPGNVNVFAGKIVRDSCVKRRIYMFRRSSLAVSCKRTVTIHCASIALFLLFLTCCLSYQRGYYQGLVVPDVRSWFVLPVISRSVVTFVSVLLLRLGSLYIVSFCRPVVVPFAAALSLWKR